MIPKFRAWHIEKKVMLPVLRISFDYREIVWGRTDEHDKWLSFDEVKLMSLTGLKDAYGTEAYAGDIVQSYEARHGVRGYRSGNNFVIRYDEKKACYTAFNCVHGNGIGNGMLYWSVMPEGKIMGNEHANPELMGEEA